MQTLKIVFTLLLIIWILAFIGYIFPLYQYGIVPRDINSLGGIIFAPFIHANLLHVIANSSGLLILGYIFFITEKNSGWSTFTSILILSGIGTWIIGRGNTVHIGASGLVYGLIGYLIFRGFYQKKLVTIIISGGIFLFYGGSLWGILPSKFYISWEGHLSGFIAGILVAKFRSDPE